MCIMSQKWANSGIYYNINKLIIQYLITHKNKRIKLENLSYLLQVVAEGCVVFLALLFESHQSISHSVSQSF